MTRHHRKQVQAAIESIREFYEIGSKLPSRETHADVYGKGIIDAEAKRIGLNPDTLRKARHFADPVKGYTREELDDLCQLIDQVQSDQDEQSAVFGRTHLIRLLSVKPKHRRAAIQRKAIQKKWSFAELEREIARCFGTRRAGGRRRRIPADIAGLLTQLEKMCESWRRWLEEVLGNPVNGKLEHPAVEDVPKEIVTLIVAVKKNLHSLQEKAIGELAKKQPGRAVRGALRKEEPEKQSRGGAKAK